MREATKDKFELMRLKARNAVKNIPISNNGTGTVKGMMGPIKGFGEL